MLYSTIALQPVCRPEACRSCFTLAVGSFSLSQLRLQVGSLAMAVNSKSSFLRGSERSLRLAVGLLTKTLSTLR